jgi:hypothetical protein
MNWAGRAVWHGRVSRIAVDTRPRSESAELLTFEHERDILQMVAGAWLHPFLELE